MPLDPLRDLQKGLIAHLKAHTPLKTWLGATVRVHDVVPPEPIYPYVLVDRVEAQPFGGIGVDATEQVVTLRVVSDFDGTEEARAIASELRVALDQAQVALDDQHLVSLRITYLDVFRGADRTVYGLVRLRAVTERIA
ncbi:DUF3168 domain-containing protein [Asticcacaulis sp. AND118]|uniref:DUF3168 domain-containing protein n=1 Tax=Asticcacaulis sp. AND118 TaxID=2840468 RepID=UPI001CFF57BA|nr:DUF3168 domain-containing protein [Asticcacaulis sp. AND118]UDF03230.1 DUF3168 domain-containing protein [Asticcacaulis sp. AND118]